MSRDLAEQRLRDALRDLEAMEARDNVPLRLGGAKPPGECPRGHAYPADPERYPPGHCNAGSPRCTLCKVRARQRCKLRAKIRRYRQIIREAAY